MSVIAAHPLHTLLLILLFFGTRRKTRGAGRRARPRPTWRLAKTRRRTDATTYKVDRGLCRDATSASRLCASTVVALSRSLARSHGARHLLQVDVDPGRHALAAGRAEAGQLRDGLHLRTRRRRVTDASLQGVSWDVWQRADKRCGGSKADEAVRPPLGHHSATTRPPLGHI